VVCRIESEAKQPRGSAHTREAAKYKDCDSPRDFQSRGFCPFIAFQARTRLLLIMETVSHLRNADSLFLRDGLQGAAVQDRVLAPRVRMLCA
jgi:hypothetical protein